MIRMMTDELSSFFCFQTSHVRIIDGYDNVSSFQLAVFRYSAVGNHAANDKPAVKGVRRYSDTKTGGAFVDSNCSHFTSVDNAFWLLRKLWFRVGRWDVEFFIVSCILCLGDLNWRFWNAFDFLGSIFFEEELKDEKREENLSISSMQE